MSIDSTDYKNYIFGLLFLKRVNDRFEEEPEEIAEEHNILKEMIRDDRDLHEDMTNRTANPSIPKIEIRRNLDLRFQIYTCSTTNSSSRQEIYVSAVRVCGRCMPQ